MEVKPVMMCEEISGGGGMSEDLGSWGSGIESVRLRFLERFPLDGGW